jgi:hypothetical protein
MNMCKVGAIMVSLGVLSMVSQVHAGAVLTYDLGVSADEHGATPTGDPPWLEAVFTRVSDNTVTLRMNSFLTPSTPEGSGEYVFYWGFSYSRNVGDLTFREDGTPGAKSETLDPMGYRIGDPSIPGNINPFFTKHNGSDPWSFFDFEFAFKHNSPQDQKFDGPEWITYVIQSSIGFTDNLSEFTTARFRDSPTIAQVNGLPGGGSTRVIVPEPYHFGLVAVVGLIGLAWRDRRRRAKRF